MRLSPTCWIVALLGLACSSPAWGLPVLRGSQLDSEPEEIHHHRRLPECNDAQKKKDRKKPRNQRQCDDNSGSTDYGSSESRSVSLSSDDNDAVAKTESAYGFVPALDPEQDRKNRRHSAKVKFNYHHRASEDEGFVAQDFKDQSGFNIGRGFNENANKLKRFASRKNKRKKNELAPVRENDNEKEQEKKKRLRRKEANNGDNDRLHRPLSNNNDDNDRPRRPRKDNKKQNDKNVVQKAWEEKKRKQKRLKRMKTEQVFEEHRQRTAAKNEVPSPPSDPAPLSSNPLFGRPQNRNPPPPPDSPPPQNQIQKKKRQGNAAYQQEGLVDDFVHDVLDKFDVRRKSLEAVKNADVGNMIKKRLNIRMDKMMETIRLGEDSYDEDNIHVGWGEEGLQAAMDAGMGLMNTPEGPDNNQNAARLKNNNNAANNNNVNVNNYLNGNTGANGEADDISIQVNGNGDAP